MKFLQDECQVNTLSNGALSFTGDAVFSLLVREKLACNSHLKAGELHRLSLSFVSAKSQTKGYETIKGILTEKEDSVFKRGRNSALNSSPKGCTLAEYRTATGVEALFGYLYLSGQTERMCELFTCISQEILHNNNNVE